MSVAHCLELAAAVYGAGVATSRTVTALWRRRARRLGVRGKLPARLPCPGIDGKPCEFDRGHAWPCWDGTPDPERARRA